MCIHMNLLYLLLYLMLFANLLLYLADIQIYNLLFRDTASCAIAVTGIVVSADVPTFRLTVGPDCISCYICIC